jgi:hypothetical protein
VQDTCGSALLVALAWAVFFVPEVASVKGMECSRSETYHRSAIMKQQEWKINQGPEVIGIIGTAQLLPYLRLVTVCRFKVDFDDALNQWLSKNPG